MENEKQERKKATPLMDFAYPNSARRDDAEKNSYTTVGHLKRSNPEPGKESRVFAMIDVLFIAPQVLMLMSAADPQMLISDYVFFSAFEPRENDPADLAWKLCCVAGHYTKDGEEKADWRTVGRIFKKQSGNGHYLKWDALAVNPVVLMQLRRLKRLQGELMLSCFVEKPEAGQVRGETPPSDEEDEIPF